MERPTREEVTQAMAVHSLSDEVRTHADPDETELIVNGDGEVQPTEDAEDK